MDKQAIISRIDEIKNEIKYFDATDYVSESQYDELLDETHDIIRINGCEYLPSEVLKEVDPIAYREGFLNYANDYDYDSISAYAALCEELENLENTLYEIELEEI